MTTIKLNIFVGMLHVSKKIEFHQCCLFLMVNVYLTMAYVTVAVLTWRPNAAFWKERVG